MRNRIGWLVVIGLFLFTSLAIACVGDECKSDGNVMYSGEGNKGDIFVYDCNKNDKSNTSIGNWVDPSFLKGDKGDKGDTGIGIQGLQGIQGIKGDTGIGIAGLNGFNGIDGQNGLDGLKGDKGEQGIQGFTGEQGIQGIQGIQGLIGNIGNTGEQGIQGVQGVQGKTGVKGDKGDKGDRGERGKGLKDQYKAGVGLRIFDTKRTQGEIAYYRDFNNQANEIVAKITIKLGSSYEEREISKTNSRLDRLEKQIGNSPTITKVVENGKTKSISISANGLAVSGDF